MDPDFTFRPNQPIIKTDHRGVEYVLVWLPLEESVQTYKAALMKRQQLEVEVGSSNAHHTLSKLWIFVGDLVPKVIRDRAHALGSK